MWRRVSLSDEGLAVVNATITGNKIEDNILGIGAVGVGSNASVNVNIQNNVLTGGGLAAILDSGVFSAVAPEETLDGSGIGIWMLGLDGGKLNNAVIANNTITDHALGIGILGLGEAQMNNGADREQHDLRQPVGRRDCRHRRRNQPLFRPSSRSRNPWFR